MSSTSALAQVFHRFSTGCDVTHSNMNGLVNRFLALQVNLAPWENVYAHATKNDGGKDLPTFKYEAKDGIIETYTREERSHQFKPDVWRSLFKGAKLSPELEKSTMFKKNAAGYVGFCQQVCDPISSEFGDDQKLMLYFLLNTKPKNMRELIYSKDLGLGLRKDQLQKLYKKMDVFNLEESNEGALAREIGSLISMMDMPVVANGSRVHMELRSMVKGGGGEGDENLRRKTFSSKSVKIPEGNGRQMARVSARMDRGAERKKVDLIFSIKESNPEGWSDAKERAVIANPVIKAYKGKMKIRFAPAQDLARQVLVSTLSPEEEHWAMASGQGQQLVNEKIDLVRKVRQNIGEITKDTGSWKDLLQIVGYSKSKQLATTPDVMDFYKYLANAIPQKERKEWTSKDLVQRFIAVHLPNWEDHWASFSWAMDPKINRSICEFLGKQPHPSNTFIETLISSF